MGTNIAVLLDCRSRLDSVACVTYFLVLHLQVRAEEPRHAFEVDMDFGAVLFYVYERV